MRTVSTAISDRYELIEVAPVRGAPSFGADVLAGLRSAPKRIPSKYLYDRVGSALFEAITHLPEYYLTRAETEILSRWGWQIVRALDAPLEFVELGSGSGAKTRLLIEEALRAQGRLRYSPIDISKEALRASSSAMIDAYPGLSIRAYAGDYFDVLASQMLKFEQKALVMFLGSNVGNYEREQARGILCLIAKALRPGDAVLLGADMKKDRATLELAYDDPAGVTAAFGKNLLARINRELGANFDLRAFRHVAYYDEERAAVDSFLQATRATAVVLSSCGERVSFAAGERIHTESSYKFEERDIDELASASGFRPAATWYDRARSFSVNLLVRD
jgi:L-histidine N-alpha-methyltransferase